MVLIGTPAYAPVEPSCTPATATVNPPAPVSAAQQGILSAPISQLYRKPLLLRMRSVSVVQGQIGDIQWQFYDGQGAPIDLTTLGLSNDVTQAGVPSDSSLSASIGEEGNIAIRFRMRENLLTIPDGNQGFWMDNPVGVVNAAQGVVAVQLSEVDTCLAGIYFGEMAAVRTLPDGNLGVLFSNTFYVTINRGQFGLGANQGPPSIMEIRLSLRDSSPAESVLLDNVRFDDAEIALAVSRCVQYFNEVSPPLNQIFTTRNFPFRHHWLEGIAAQLFYMVEEQQRANQLDYSAGGLAVNDQNKEQPYGRAGDRRWQNYKEFVTNKKAELNLAACWGSLGSQYADFFHE